MIAIDEPTVHFQQASRAVEKMPPARIPGSPQLQSLHRRQKLEGLAGSWANPNEPEPSGAKNIEPKTPRLKSTTIQNKMFW